MRSQAEPEADWGRLPINPQSKKLNKACFIYGAKRDIHFCPGGEAMPFEEKKTETNRAGETIT